MKKSVNQKTSHIESHPKKSNKQVALVAKHTMAAHQNDWHDQRQQKSGLLMRHHGKEADWDQEWGNKEAKRIVQKQSVQFGGHKNGPFQDTHLFVLASLLSLCLTYEQENLNEKLHAHEYDDQVVEAEEDETVDEKVLVDGMVAVLDHVRWVRVVFKKVEWSDD
jgi:hypothetical protein